MEVAQAELHTLESLVTRAQKLGCHVIVRTLLALRLREPIPSP